MISNLLSNGLRLGLVSGSGGKGVFNTLSRHGLIDKFCVRLLSGRLSHDLNPPPYLLAFNRLGLEASDCLAVEDSRNGWRSATEAKVQCLKIAHTPTSHFLF